jgi:hypothetical protein
MRRGGRTRWLAVLVVCGLLFASASGGVVTAQPTSLQFANAVTTDQRGDVVDVPIRVGNRGYVALSVRAPDGTYDTRVRVVDADDDGRVTVSLDTFSAGWAADEATAYAAGAGDRITDVDRQTRRLDGPLPAGRYNLVVASGGESTAASLVVEPGRVGNATTATVPADRLPGDAAATPRFETGHVAVGDGAVVAFDVSGIGGVLASTPPPGENLVYPVDSTPGTTTTHVVGVDADRRVSVETVTVRYAEGGAPRTLDRLGADRLRALGIDRDGDGIVETDLRSAVERIERSDRSLTIHLDTEATVGAGGTLLVSYRATNPDEAGTYAVNASLGDEVATDGRVVYGLAGRGTLGYGLDLRFTAASETVVDPLAAVNYTYADDRLYALVNTSSLAVDGRYGVGLTRWAASPLADETAAAGATVRLTERRATLVEPAPAEPFVVTAGERTFRASTTLSPGTEVVVTVAGDAPNSFLFQQSTRVDEDRAITATFDLPGGVDRQSVTLRIVDDGAVLTRERGVIGTESAGE